MTHEEAINIVKTQYPHDSVMKEALGTLIPELRESEDERVIRTLYYLVRDHDWLNGATKEEALTWLEKQKEQKPCEPKNWPADKDTLTQEQKPVVTHGETYRVDTLGTQQVIAGKMPQKPAGWSEEDADILNCCISSIEEAKENRYAYKETDGDTSYDHEIAWLKSLRPSWKPNEEQMDRLFSIVAALRKDYCDDMADFLASLYEQLKKL